MSAAGDTVLDVRGARIVSERDGDRPFALTLKRLHLSAGDCVALTGPTGSGKSTCLEFLSLLRVPETLDAFLLHGDHGVDDLTRTLMLGQLDRLSRLRAGPVGFVAQSGGVLPFLNARENGSLGVDLTGRSDAPEIRERLNILAGRLKLGADLGKSRGALSGGQRKRVALMRGLSVPRRLLILDEPTSGLDTATAQGVMALIRDLCAREGTACIAAMHDLALAAEFGFRPLEVRTGGASAAHIDMDTDR